MSYTGIKSIDKQIGTPFYIMYPSVYQSNLTSFVNAFKQRYDRIIAGYSFKTNYVPALCLKAKDQGCFAEVVSEMEYQIAENLGFKNIIFNGPIKKEAVLFHALNSKALVNLDSGYEVDSVINYKQEHLQERVEIGLRINVMLTDSEGNSTIQCGLKAGRFGFTMSDLERTIKRLRDNNIKIVSLHGHTSSSDRVPSNYRVICLKMLEVIHDFNLEDIKYFDVGGGFFGAAAKGFDITGRPSYEDYANAILDTVLNDTFFVKTRPFIIIEPGASVVSNVFDYVTKVFQTKKIGNVDFASIDGSVFDVRPTMHTYNAPFEVMQQKPSILSKVYDVVGSTCMEKDVVLKNVTMPELHHGDYIVLRGVGSYTISLTPTFINYLAPIICVNGDKIKVVRNRQSIKDVLGVYEY